MSESSLPAIDTLRARASVRVERIRNIVSGGAALVALDVSGIQRFIFNIATEKAASEVKARSFLVALVPKVLSWRARSSAGLGVESEVLVAAGRSVLAVPEAHLEQVLASLREDARAIRDATGDTLAIDVASRALSKTAFEESGAASFGAAYRELCEGALPIARCRRADSTSNDFWTPVAADQTSLADLGRMLRSSADRAAVVGVARGSASDGRAFRWAPLNISIATGGSLAEVGRQLEGPRLFLQTDGSELGTAPDAGDELAALPLAGAWIKADGETPLDFDGLAASAEGDPKLGVLRMDLDSLGESFGGVTRNKAAADGLRDLLALSDAVNLCCGPLADAVTWSPGGPRNVQWILAGGDDLFLVGAWSEVIEVAQAIRGAIVPALKSVAAELASKEAAAKLDISAGLVIAPSGVPLSHLADQAEEQIATAKRPRDTQNGSMVAKAALSWGGLAIGWKDWGVVLDLARELTQAIRRNHIARSVLRRLAGIHALWRDAEAAKGKEGAVVDAAKANAQRWLWAYHLGRAGDGLDDQGRELLEWLSNFALEKRDNDDARAKCKTEHEAAALLGMVAEIAHRATRAGREERR